MAGAIITAIVAAGAAERSARHAARRYTERSRVARCAATVAVVGCTVMLAARWLRTPLPPLLPYAAGWTAVAVVVEWRRKPTGWER